MSNGAISQAEYNKLFNIVDEIKKENILKMIAKPSLEEVRLMLENAKLKVLELKRIRIGSIQLGNLAIGKKRPLSPYENFEILEKK